jgi:hypothetical protein
LLTTCGNISHNQSGKTSADAVTIEFPNKTDTTGNNTNIVTTDFQTNINKTFYRILDNVVYTYQIYKIVDSEKVLDYLDMEWVEYKIDNVNIGTDTIKIIFKTVENVEDGFFIIHNTNLILRKNYMWNVYFNDDFDNPYKYTLIDSLDLLKSDYAIDTLNHWLDEVEY